MGKNVSKEKLEYEKLLNELFGVDIRWRRLSIDDLKLLAFVLSNESTRKEICQRLSCPRTYLDISRIAGLIDEIVPEEKQGPLLKLLKGLARGERGDNK